jgi:acyl-coenzyme A thioesterase PaaI-like protein
MTDDSGAAAGDRSRVPSRPDGGAPMATPGSEGWTEMINEYATATPSPRRVELHRTGDALRRIVHRLHGSVAAAGELADVADDLERLARRLDDLTVGSMYEGFGEAPLAGADPHAFFDHSPMLGRANPLAPPIDLWTDGQVLRGRATFEAAYEGPPGCVHGGYVAAAFDEVLGSTQSLGGRPGMTGRLTVHYRSPTPLRTELTFSARVVDVTGRKTLTHGTLHAGDRLCAEAEGLFIAIDFDKMTQLRAERERRFQT